MPVCDHVLLGRPGTAEAGVDSRPTGRLRLLQVQKRVGLPPQAAESAAPSLRPGPERAVVSSGNAAPRARVTGNRASPSCLSSSA